MERQYKFRAKDIKTGNWVEGDLAYVQTCFETPRVKTMIVEHFIHGGMLWMGNRWFVDEDTIVLIRNEKGEV